MEPGLSTAIMELREELIDHNAALKDRILTGLKEMYFSESLCDVTIQTEDEHFLCHRVVLASVSPYFRALFTSPMKEAVLGEICLSDVPSPALQVLLNYIYTGEVDITMDNVEELFTVSGRLQITAMQDACSRYLAKRIENENCLWIYRLAHSHNHGVLLEETMTHIVWNLSFLSGTEEFLHLEMEELVNILTSDDLMVSSELDVYNLAHSWWKFHTKDDDLLPPELLKVVRLPLLTPAELEQVSRDIPSDDDSLLQPPTGIRLRQGMFEERIVCMDSRSFDTADPEEAYHFNAYDPITESWERLPFCGHFEQTAIVTVGCNLYVSGGCEKEGSPSNALHVYDSVLNDWKELPSMTSPRACHGFLAYRNMLYAFGGYNSELTDSVECFNVLDNSWRNLSSMPKALHSFASAVLKGSLFAIGGMARKEIDIMHYPGFQIYDIRTDTWSQFPLSEVFSAVGAVALRDKVYVIASCKPRPDDLNAYPAFDENLQEEDHEAYLVYNEEPNTIGRSFCMDHLGRICQARIPPVLESTSFSAIVRWMHTIYILGGTDGHFMSLFTIFYWSPGQPKWTVGKDEVPFLITDFGTGTLRVPLKHLSSVIPGRRSNYQFRLDIGEISGRILENLEAEESVEAVYLE